MPESTVAKKMLTQISEEKKIRMDLIQSCKNLTLKQHTFTLCDAVYFFLEASRVVV